MHLRDIKIWAGAVVLGLAGVASADTPLNLLFFGNSYTQGWYPPLTAGGPDAYYNVPDAVGKLAVADGHSAPKVVQELAGGQSLSYHVTQAQTKPTASVSAITPKQYDYVVLQDLSTRPADKTSSPAGIAQFRADVKTLTDLVRQGSPNAGTILYETWAKGSAGSVYPNAYANPATMQADLTKNYAQAAADLNALYGANQARVARVGTAFGKLDWSSATLYNPDSTHANVLGYRLSAMVLYRTIYHENVSDIPYAAVSSWIGVNEQQYTQIQQIADAMPIPEPASMGAGVIVLTLLGRRRRSRA